MRRKHVFGIGVVAAAMMLGGLVIAPVAVADEVATPDVVASEAAAQAEDDELRLDFFTPDVDPQAILPGMVVWMTAHVNPISALEGDWGVYLYPKAGGPWRRLASVTFDSNGDWAKETGSRVIIPTDLAPGEYVLQLAIPNTGGYSDGNQEITVLEPPAPLMGVYARLDTTPFVMAGNLIPNGFYTLQWLDANHDVVASEQHVQASNDGLIMRDFTPLAGRTGMYAFVVYREGFDVPTGSLPFRLVNGVPQMPSIEGVGESAGDASGEGAPTAAQGDEFTITGKGAEPNTTYWLSLDPGPVLLGSVTTDASGAFNTTVKIPADTTLGNHHISLTVDEEGCISVAEFDLEVTPAESGDTSDQPETEPSDQPESEPSDQYGDTSDQPETKPSDQSGDAQTQPEAKPSDDKKKPLPNTGVGIVVVLGVLVASAMIGVVLRLGRRMVR